MIQMKLFVIFVIACNLCGFTMSTDVANAFVTNEVVPDVVDVAPQEELKVTYPNGILVNFGAELTPTAVKDVPKVEWRADSNQLYTLIMADPDAPSRAEPKYRSFNHWTVINIPGSDVAKGNEVVEYIGAGAPNGTGLHRYVFLAYKQTDGQITYDEPIVSNKSRQCRPSWSPADFVKKFNLGNPIAGNFFQAKFDDYVPILHAQLSGK